MENEFYDSTENRTEYQPGSPSGGGPEKKPEKGKNAVIAALAAVIIIAAAVFAYLTVSGRLTLNGGKNESTTDSSSRQSVENGTAASSVPASSSSASGATTVTATEAKNSGDGRYTPASYVVATKSGLRMRDSHDTGGTTLETVPQGTVLDVTEIYFTASGDPETSYWGKTSFNGSTGWVTMYYLTCDEQTEGGNIASDADFKAIIKKYCGYYNKENDGEFIILSESGDRIIPGMWYSETGRPLIISKIRSCKNGIVAADVYSEEETYMDVQYEREESQIIFDISEIENGRICAKFINSYSNKKWAEYFYAGATQDEAIPPLESIIN